MYAYFMCVMLYYNISCCSKAHSFMYPDFFKGTQEIKSGSYVLNLIASIKYCNLPSMLLSRLWTELMYN